MSHFKTRLVAELVDDANELWRLTGPLVYSSDLVGNVVVPEGFVTDFASVPRLPFAYFMAGNTARWASVIHDYLYVEKSLPRDVCDAVFLEAMAASGVPRWRRGLMWLAVRAFGGIAY